MDLEAKSTISSWIGLILSACALPAFVWVSLYGHPALGFSGLIAEQQLLSPADPPNPLVSISPEPASNSGQSPIAAADQSAETQSEENDNLETTAEPPAEADAVDALPEVAAESATEDVTETVTEAVTEAVTEVVAETVTEVVTEDVTQEAALQPEDRSIGDPPPSLDDSSDNLMPQVDTAATADEVINETATPEVDIAAAQAKLAAVLEERRLSESTALEKAGERARDMAREYELQRAAQEQAEELAKAQVSRENQALADAGEKARQMARDRKAQLLAAEAAQQLEEKEQAIAARQQAQLEAQQAQAARQEQALLDAGNRARQLASERKAQQLAAQKAEKQAAKEETARLQQAHAAQQEQALVEAGNAARQMQKEQEAKQLAERQSAEQATLAVQAAQAARENQALLAAGNKARGLANEAQAAKLAEQQNQALIAAGDKARELAKEAQASKLAASAPADAASLVLEISAEKASLSAVMTEDDIAESVLDKLVSLLSPAAVTEDISYFKATRGGEQLLESLDLLVNELSASDVMLSAAEISLKVTENSIAANGQLASDEDADALQAMLESVFTDRDLDIRLNGETVANDAGDETDAGQEATQLATQTSTEAAVPPENTFEAIRAREINLLTQQSENLQFKPGDWVISQSLREPLDLIFETLFLYAEVTVNLTVYAGDSDDEVMNKFVSQQRARSIRRYLTDRGLGPDRVTTVGAGNPEGGPTAKIEVTIKEN